MLFSRRAVSAAARIRHHQIVASPASGRSTHHLHHQQPQRAWLSSLNEPTLFPAAITNADDAIINSSKKNLYDDAMLRSDVRTMGTLLGDAIALHHGEDVLKKVEQMR